jgi:hypothetical protein
MKYIKQFEDRYGDDETYPAMVKHRQQETAHLKVGDHIEYWKDDTEYIYEILDLCISYRDNLYSQTNDSLLKVKPLFFYEKGQWLQVLGKDHTDFIKYRKNEEIPIKNPELIDMIELHKATTKYNL